MGVNDINEMFGLAVDVIKVCKEAVSDEDGISSEQKRKKRRSKALVDEIRCDEKSYLIWKWHPVGTKAGENDRENAIRYGSSLRVKEGEVAAFIYTLSGQQVQEYIVGPADQVLATSNFPGLANLLGTVYGGGTPFQAEIYFINVAERIQMRFAVPFFDLYDAGFKDIGVSVAVRGNCSFRIDDYRAFIRLHKLEGFSLSEFQTKIKTVFVRHIKDIILNLPNTSIVQIEQKTEEITKIVEPILEKHLKLEFAVTLCDLNIETIEIDKSSDAFGELTRRMLDNNQSSNSLCKEIEKYSEMFNKGILTKSEFEEIKKKLIQQM